MQFSHFVLASLLLLSADASASNTTTTRLNHAEQNTTHSQSPIPGQDIEWLSDIGYVPVESTLASVTKYLQATKDYVQTIMQRITDAKELTDILVTATEELNTRASDAEQRAEAAAASATRRKQRNQQCNAREQEQRERAELAEAQSAELGSLLLETTERVESLEAQLEAAEANELEANGQVEQLEGRVENLSGELREVQRELGEMKKAEKIRVRAAERAARRAGTLEDREENVRWLLEQGAQIIDSHSKMEISATQLEVGRRQLAEATAGETAAATNTFREANDAHARAQRRFQQDASRLEEAYKHDHDGDEHFEANERFCEYVRVGHRVGQSPYITKEFIDLYVAQQRA